MDAKWTRPRHGADTLDRRGSAGKREDDGVIWIYPRIGQCREPEVPDFGVESRLERMHKKNATGGWVAPAPVGEPGGSLR